MPPEVPQPWRDFLKDVDAGARAPATLHCLGGFVVALQYGMPRPTADIDLLAILPEASRNELLALAGRGSPLHRKHRVYIDVVVPRAEPADYPDRLTEMFAGAFERLRLMALDPYDLALTKLDRNSPRDREDFLFLARSVPLDLSILRARYESDVAPYVFDAMDRVLRLTLELWIRSAEEVYGESPGS